jgi:HlyD family secretion protein
MMIKFMMAGATAATLAAVALGLHYSLGADPGVVRLPGTVEVQEVRLGSKVGGRVPEVLVAEGDIVLPDQVLARFDVPELGRGN